MKRFLKIAGFAIVGTAAGALFGYLGQCAGNT